MWANRLCLCRKFFISFPLIKSPAYIPRTYSILSKVSQISTAKYKSFQNINLLKQSILRLNWPVKRLLATKLVASPKYNPQKIVGYWLLGCSGMVYSAVVLGGITRLTESGLSMVTWRFTYEKYPSSEEEWAIEFKKYQEYPEFKQLKKDITLEEFKSIWKTEYLHRNWGRFLGLMFFIPATSFWLKKYFLPNMKKRIIIFGLLIGAQGLLGWYMVRSGLEDRFHKETDIPRVSQYRLAAHLGLALTLYIGFLWSAFELLLPIQALSSVNAGAKKLRMLAHSCKGLVFLTALSGAFVAGLDAGLIYNSFPKMADKWIPDDILALSPKHINFTENPTTVQFNHRLLGVTTAAAILATWGLSRKYALPHRARMAMNILALGACCQVTLGIATLVHYVPVSLAVMHQTGSVALLTLAVWLSQELKKIKYIPK